VGSIIDRSGGKVDFGVPFESLLKLDLPVYDPEDCPLCKQGIPAEKPGSRGLK
jgi:orotate phosphoribosyltransferase